MILYNLKLIFIVMRIFERNIKKKEPLLNVCVSEGALYCEFEAQAEEPQLKSMAP